MDKMKVKDYPKNKEKFIKLKKFARQILKILKKIRITPVAYGSLVYFAYTKDKNVKVNDFDFLLHEKDFPKIMENLNKKKIKYRHVRKDHSIQVFQRKIKIELDAIGDWEKSFPKTFNKINFNGLIVSAVNIKTLKKIYKEATKIIDRDTPKYCKKLEVLKKLK